MLSVFGKRRAIKSYARKLPALLKKDYGSSDKYTVGQVRRSIERHGLNERHILYAYAMFVDREAFADMNTGITYDDLRQDVADSHFEGNLDFSVTDMSASSYGGDDISDFSHY